MFLTLRVFNNVLKRTPKRVNLCSSIIRLNHIKISTVARNLRPESSKGLKQTHFLRINLRQYASDSNLPNHIKIPLPALSPTMELGTIVTWEKDEGDRLEEGDLLAEIETDKATMGFETPEEGYLAKILIPAGTKNIPIGKLLCIIVENEADISAFKDFVDSGEVIKSKPKSKPSTPATSPPPPTTSAAAAPTTAPSYPTATAPRPTTTSSPSGGRIFASPLARKVSKDSNISLAGIQGSGPQGRIRSQDLQGISPGSAGVGGYTDVQLTQMREVIARKMVESKQTIPHYYLTIEVEVDSLLKIREKLNKTLKEGKLSINDFVIKATALASLQVPEVNSSWQGDFIRQYSSVNVSVAVSTGKGLIAPVILEAEKKGLTSVNQEVLQLAQKAKEGKLQVSELQDGTITVSNLGMYQINNFSAIITPPQACALAVGGITKRLVPCSEKGSRAASYMTLTLSCDHRVVDGAVGAQWLQHLRKYLETPETMLL